MDQVRALHDRIALATTRCLILMNLERENMSRFSNCTPHNSLRRKSHSVGLLGMNLEGYEERLMLSATVATVEPKPAAITADFSGTWNVETNVAGSGTVVIVQADADANLTVNLLGESVNATGKVRGDNLKIKTTAVVDDRTIKVKAKATLNGEDSFTGKAKAKVEGIGKVVVTFTGDRVSPA